MENAPDVTSAAGEQSDSTVGLGITGTLTGPLTLTIPTQIRTENNIPGAYRLAKKPDGTLVLQGAYFWQEGWKNCGHEWRDIPTVDL